MNTEHTESRRATLYLHPQLLQTLRLRAVATKEIEAIPQEKARQNPL